MKSLSWFIWAMVTVLAYGIGHFYGFVSGVAVFGSYFLGGLDATVSIAARRR